MSQAPRKHPVLLLNPDHHEASYLCERLRNERVSQPVVCFTTSADLQDYLEAAQMAAPIERRFIPCVILVDEKLGPSEIRALAAWIRQQPELRGTSLVTLTDRTEDTDEKPAGVHHVVCPAVQLQGLTRLIARACG